MAIVIPGVSQLQRWLSVLPVVGSRVATPDLLMNPESSGAFAESFRLLALNISVALTERPSKGVVVMSAFPKDGRSLIAANLASALAERGETMLHDGDSRATTPIGTMFTWDGVNGAAGRQGSRDIVELPEYLRELVQPVNRAQLWLTGGRSSYSGKAGRLDEILRTASGAGIVTVVDSPPASVSSAAFSLAQEAGQVVYVVRRVAQDMDIHRQIREQLRRLNVDIVGLVMNEA